MPVAIAHGVQESLLEFRIGEATSLGLVAEPEGQPSASVGVLIVVGGPQYRVGAHRHFVLLARQLATAGFTSLRFDHCGLGDCVAPLRSFEALDDDIESAIQALMQARPQLQGVVIWGLCDAAAAALLYLARRPAERVRGLVLLNPWVRSAQTEAATRIKHYYWERLRSPAFWRKLLGGGVGLQALHGWWQARMLARQAPQSEGGATGFQDQMAQGWNRSGAPLLLQLCTADLTAQEFVQATASRPSWQGAWGRPLLERRDYVDADHTFSQPQALQAALDDTVVWLKRNFQA